MSELLELKISESLKQIQDISGCTLLEADLVLALMIGMFLFSAKQKEDSGLTEDMIKTCLEQIRCRTSG